MLLSLLLKRFFNTSGKSLKVLNEQHDYLIDLKDQLFSPKKGLVYVSSSLYNFLTNDYKPFSLKKFDVTTGVKLTTYCKTSTAFNDLVYDCLHMGQIHYDAKYNNIPTFFGDSQMKFFGDWYDNDESINEIFEVLLPALLGVYNYTQKHPVINENDYIPTEPLTEMNCTHSDYVKNAGLIERMKRQYTGVESFIERKDLVTLVNEALSVLITLSELTIRGLGGNKI